jgi:hypothetical protein
MSLFQGKIDASRSKKPSGATRETKVAKKKDDSEPKTSGISRKESWLCFVCGEDRLADMRLLSWSLKYVHEERVGITAKDKCIHFKCPEFEYSD